MYPFYIVGIKGARGAGSIIRYDCFNCLPNPGSIDGIAAADPRALCPVGVLLGESYFFLVGPTVGHYIGVL